jgi:hypothetical protein
VGLFENLQSAVPESSKTRQHRNKNGSAYFLANSPP